MWRAHFTFFFSVVFAAEGDDCPETLCLCGFVAVEGFLPPVAFGDATGARPSTCSARGQSARWSVQNKARGMMSVDEDRWRRSLTLELVGEVSLDWA